MHNSSTQLQIQVRLRPLLLVWELKVLADRPDFWPETVRALIVHSAEWTIPMRRYLDQDNSRNHKHSVLRRYGYGVPNLQRCLFSSRNDLTLIVEDRLRPFQKDGSRIRTPRHGF